MTSEVDVKNITTNISFHSFNANVGEVLIRFEVLKLKDSIYLWIGNARCRNMNDLSLALMSRFSKEAASTKIMGDPTNLTSMNLANKLSKKLNKPVYVSYNLPDDRLTVPAINLRIFEEIKLNGQHF